MITFAFRGVTGVNSVFFEQLPVFGAFHSHGQWTIPIYKWRYPQLAGWFISWKIPSIINFING